MDSEVVIAGPPPVLSKKFDQSRAVERRIKWEQGSLEEIDKALPTPGTHLLATTVILPDSQSFDIDDYLSEAEAESIQTLVAEALERDRSILLITGAIEVDYCLKGSERYWQRTMHLSIVVVAVNFERAKEKVRKAFGLKTNPLVRQPVRSKAMPTPLNWVRYCYKSLSYGSVVRKSSYAANPDKGTRKGSCKQSLQKPERDAMLKAMTYLQWSKLRILATNHV